MANTQEEILLKKRAELLESIQPVRKLYSGFFNMSSYYYSEVLDKIYKIENLTPKLCVPSYDEERILREENNLPIH